MKKNEVLSNKNYDLSQDILRLSAIGDEYRVEKEKFLKKVIIKIKIKKIKKKIKKIN
jgi:hypothetical protein